MKLMYARKALITHYEDYGTDTSLYSKSVKQMLIKNIINTLVIRMNIKLEKWILMT